MVSTGRDCAGCDYYPNSNIRMSPEIADDIETLLEFVRHMNKNELGRAASRVEVWLATYKSKK